MLFCWQVVQQLGDVEELQRKLGLAVLVTNQTLQEAPHRFGELLAHLSHTDIVLKAKAALAQVRAQCRVCLSKVVVPPAQTA